MDTLPDDPLLHIFSFIHSGEDFLSILQVCQHWRRMAVWAPLWKDVKVAFFGVSEETNRSAYQCMKKAPVLGCLTLDMDNSSAVECSKALSKILLHYPKKIRKLSIRNCNLTEENYTKLIRCFSDHLEELELIGTRLDVNKRKRRNRLNRLSIGALLKLRAFTFSDTCSHQFWLHGDTASLYPALKELHYKCSSAFNVDYVLYAFVFELTSEKPIKQLQNITVEGNLHFNEDAIPTSQLFLNVFPNLELLCFKSDLNGHLIWRIGNSDLETHFLSNDLERPSKMLKPV